MRHLTLRLFGIIGSIIFVPLFLFTFSNPHAIEKSAKSFIEWQLRAEVEHKIEDFQISTSTTLGALLNKAAGDKVESLKKQLKDDLPAILAREIAKIRNLDCECRKRWEQRIQQSIKMNIVTLEAAKEKLIDFTQAKYMSILEKLIIDIRIFLGINSVIFFIFLITSFLKPKAVVHLFLPGVLLLASTLICIYFYLFEQNWFYTIIYNDYTGYTYLGYLGIVFSVLCDIVLNRGWITTQILNGVCSIAGSAAEIVPC